MVGVLLVAIAIPVCLLGAQLFWGAEPTRPRIVATIWGGIVAAIVVWMLVAKLVGLPEESSVTAVLSVELIVLAAVLGMTGQRRVAA